MGRFSWAVDCLFDLIRFCVWVRICTSSINSGNRPSPPSDSAPPASHFTAVRTAHRLDRLLTQNQGISLTIQQFNALVALLPHIETVLADKGESITRPEYSAESGTGAGKEIAVAEGNEDEFVADAGEGKRNFEETSDEE